jgi:hypothetical protein
MRVCVTSFCQPLLSFLSKPARIDATPVLYEKSREKYLKKSISLGNEERCVIIEEPGSLPKGNIQLANAICICGPPSLPQQLDVIKEPEGSSANPTTSHADEMHTKYCDPRYEYHPVCGYQRVTHRRSEDMRRTCEIGRIGGICCKLGSTGGFLTWTRK